MTRFMLDLICDVVSHCAWSCDMGETDANGKIL